MLALLAAAPALAELPPHAERLAAAEAGYALAVASHRAGALAAEGVCAWSVRWHDAARDAGRADAAALHLERAVALEAAVRQAVAAGTAGRLDAAAAAWCLAEARVWAAPR